MVIKWNKSAIKQLADAIDFIEEAGFYSYAEELEKGYTFKGSKSSRKARHLPFR
jgi:hypothetical protein